MTFETDEAALARVRNSGLLFDDELMVKGDAGAPQKIYNIFFVYMRINTDGMFLSERYLFRGDPANPVEITRDTDPSVAGSLGWYTKDMALAARRQSGKYPSQGKGLTNFAFPQYRAYVVFFMDDLHWPFLGDENDQPVVPFHSRKGNNQYAKHTHAFTRATKFPVMMPNTTTGADDKRHALMMINRMRNANDVDLSLNERENFCFDLIMRVQCAGSTDALTIIIDPTGENMGPPLPPP